MGLVKRDFPLTVSLPVAAVVASGLGFAAGMVGQEIAAAVDYIPEGSPAPLGTGLYTYGDDECSGSQRKDPINVLFVNGGTIDRVTEHAEDHGDWDNGSGGTQWFRELHDDLCGRMDAQRASQGAGLNRYHMRFHLALDFDGEPLDLPTLGLYSSADAHYEVWKPGCGFFDVPPGNHSVMDQRTSYSIGGHTVYGGFNRGRENLWYNWVEDGPHDLVDTVDWDNEQRFIQCDPKDWVPGHDNPDEAWSDGYVYYIGAKH